MPGYWMNETTGVLRPAVMAYLEGVMMSDKQVAAVRAYLRQWIMSDMWDQNPSIDPEARQWLRGLRSRIDGLVDEDSIRKWARDALEGGIDPF
jgi:hypothetical protein